MTSNQWGTIVYKNNTWVLGKEKQREQEDKRKEK